MVHELDPSETALLGRVHDIAFAVHGEAMPDVPFRSRRDTIERLRHPAAAEPARIFVGEVDGFARVALPQGSRSAWLELAVLPAARRRGLGAALAAAAVAAARETGHTELAGRHGTEAGAAFARRLGAVAGRVDVTSVVALPTLLPTSAGVAGYELRSWCGSTPEDLLASYVEARNAANDAPGAGDADDYIFTAESVRSFEHAVARRGREIWVTAALAQGSVVSCTEIRVTPGEPLATTEDTATLAEHRRRGLASWIKAESLARLVAVRPEVRFVTTTNAASNASMLGINRRLGFREAGRAVTAVLPLDPSPVQ